MKILWHGVPSNYPTGYGVQTRLFTRALRAAGHDVVISPNCMNVPPFVNDEGLRVLSAGPRFNNGNDFILFHVEHEQPDIVLSMIDTFAMDSKRFSQVPWAAWQVVDSAPMLPEMKKSAAAAARRIAMSKFGQQVLLDAGHDSTYIPLAYDPMDYYPSDRAKARAILEHLWKEPLSDRFVMVMCAANMSRPSRKNFSAALRTVKWMKDQGANPALYIHTECTGKLTNGEDLREMSEAIGLSPGDVMFPDQYEYAMGTLSAAYLRTIYNAADLYLCTSRGEGFGVPLIDAQACGLPCVSVDFSSMPELMIGPSRSVKEYVLWDYHPGTAQAIVEPSAVGHAAMMMRLEMRKSPEAWANRCLQMAAIARRDYSVEAVMEKHMIPFLAKWASDAPRPVSESASANEPEKESCHETRSQAAVCP